MEVTHKSEKKKKIYRPCHRLETFSSALTQSDTSPQVVAQLPRCMQLFVTQGLQHARPPCASPPPRVCPHYVYCISFSDTVFCFCPQSFPASRTFPMRHLFASDDQNNGVSASASVLIGNIHSWSPLRSTVFFFLLSKELSGVFSSTTVWRHQFFCILPSLRYGSHNRMWPLGRP